MIIKEICTNCNICNICGTHCIINADQTEVKCLNCGARESLLK